MPISLLTLAEELAPYVVAVISVLGVVFTAYHERASQLKAAYFQKMSDAYEQYFDALVRYVYNDPPGKSTSLVVATHTAALYASAEISGQIEFLTKMALSCRQTGAPDIHELTGYLADFSACLHRDAAYSASQRARPRNSSPQIRDRGPGSARQAHSAQTFLCPPSLPLIGKLLKSQSGD